MMQLCAKSKTIMHADLIQLARKSVRHLLRMLRLGRGQTDYATRRVVLVAAFGVIANPLCYLLWHRLWPAEFESVPLRLVGVALCGVGLFAGRFRQRWLNLYLLIALSYSLPFFFTFMCLMNHATPVWTESLLISLIALFHFDMVTAALAYCIGTLAACIAVLWQGRPELLLNQHVLEQLPIHGFAIIVLSVVKVSRDALEREKLAGMQAGLATVSHELRTPLASVEANVRGLLRLVGAGAENVESRLKRFDALSRIQFEVRHMNHMIDMFLVSATAVNRNLRPREQVSMAGAIDCMLKRYPFSNAAQRCAVAIDVRRDFVFAGQADLAVVILLNLMRNALKAVHRAGKGRVRIVVDGDRGTPRLLFIDTACGVPTRHLPLIFRRFYSYPPHQGSGIGLALCRDIMLAWNASIRCVSREQAYAIFVLEFPRDPATIR
jgi:two-component system CAI-1 autoinducer sensor kinase/phosphatase CqsS